VQVASSFHKDKPDLETEVVQDRVIWISLLPRKRGDVEHYLAVRLEGSTSLTANASSDWVARLPVNL
jgi:hypothetical protein